MQGFQLKAKGFCWKVTGLKGLCGPYAGRMQNPFSPPSGVGVARFLSQIRLLLLLFLLLPSSCPPLRQIVRRLPYTRQPELQVSNPSRHFSKILPEAEKLNFQQAKMQFYIKNFSPFRDRVFEKKILSAPSARKALVLLSHQKFPSRFARKKKEGGDRSKYM